MYVARMTAVCSNCNHEWRVEIELDGYEWNVEKTKNHVLAIACEKCGARNEAAASSAQHPTP